MLFRSHVSAVLKKTDQPLKTFPLDIIQFGEKVKTESLLAEHFFYTSSPLAHIPATVPQRTVYFCVQGDYRDSLRSAINGFRTEVLNLKYSLIERAEQVSAPEMLKEIQRLANDYSAKVMEQVQVEAGNYELTLTVQYKNPQARYFRTSYAAESKISFTVPTDVKTVIRDLTKQMLSANGENLLLDKTTKVVYPEYNPVQVKEL